MFCPNCGGKCEDSHRFCFHCGAALPVIEQTAHENTPAEDTLSLAEELSVYSEEEPLPEMIDPAAPAEDPAPEIEHSSPEENTFPPEPESQPAPSAPKEGRLWPPVLIMIVMSVIGLAFFLFSDRPSAMVTDPSAPWFQIQDGVLYFDESLYFGPSELSVPEIIGGQSVTALSEGCFAECQTLTTVILPETLKHIGARAFAGCSKLVGMYIPDSVTSIAEETFASCGSLIAVYIQESVESIGQNTFDRCVNLEHVFFSGDHAQWASLYDGILGSNTYVHCSDGTYQYTPKK